MADFTATGHEVQMFSTQVGYLLGQQAGPSRLLGLCSQGSYSGETASPVNQFGFLAAQTITTANVPIIAQDIVKDRRWVVPLSFDLAVHNSFLEWMKTGMNPQGVFVKRVADAFGNYIDAMIGTAMYAAALTGETAATTTTVYDTGMQVAVNYGAGANVGLTLKKLLQARLLLENQYKGNVNEPMTCVITPRQKLDLFQEIGFTNRDYNTDGGSAYATGELSQTLGINMVVSTHIPVDGSSFRRVPLFVPNAMHVGTWKSPTITVSIRTDLVSQPEQTYGIASMGATRLDESLIASILCSEA